MTEEQIEWLVRRYRTLAAAQAEMQAEMDQIKVDISAAVDVGWGIEVDGKPARKQPGRRKFSMTLAVSNLSAEEREECKRLSFDSDKVRDTIEAKGLLEDCMEDVGSEPIVVLK